MNLCVSHSPIPYLEPETKAPSPTGNWGRSMQSASKFKPSRVWDLREAESVGFWVYMVRV